MTEWGVRWLVSCSCLIRGVNRRSIFGKGPGGAKGRETDGATDTFWWKVLREDDIWIA